MDSRRTMNRAAMYIHDPIDPIAGINNQEKNIKFLRERIDDLFTRYKDNIEADPWLDEALRADLYFHITAYETEIHRYFDYYITNLIVAARAFDEPETIRLVRAGIDTVYLALEHYQYLDDTARLFMHSINDELTIQTNMTFWILIVLSVIGVFIGIAATLLISNAITKPLQRVVSTLTYVSQGELDVNIDAYNITNDETGMLTRDVLTLIDNIKSIKAEVQGLIIAAADEGDLHYEIEADKYSGEWREIMTGLNRLAKAVDTPIVEIRNVMNTLSYGDFGHKVIGDYKGDFLQIKDAINDTIDALARHISNEVEREREQEKRLLEEDLNQRIRSMFDATPLIIEVWNKAYTPIDCNKTTLDYYGLSDKEEYKKNMWHFFTHEHLGTSKWRKYLDEIFESGFGYFEFADQKLDGENTFLDVTGVHMKLNNEDVVVTYSNDVTQIKELQKEQQRIQIAEESNQAKSRFLARMSHEIRTPITAVMGISEIELQSSDLPVRIDSAFTKIYNSANSLLSIVNDILDLSKIEAGKMGLLQEEYEVASLIIDAAQLHLAYLGSKDIRFNLDIDENLPSYLIGDVIRIGQIMNNLLSNAFKYTELGSINLSLRCQKDDTKDDVVMLVISIEDTGFGMTPEHLNNLSNEYTRFHEHENRFIDGTGLGMPIVFSLIQMMNAHINIDSKVNIGTKVTVTIPQKVVNTEVLGKESALNLQHFGEGRITARRFALDPEPMPYGRVLVVDDVEANLYVAKGLLSFYDLKVETCNSGYCAIDKIKAGNIYDIVFMDHMMPGMNGIEAMQKMRDIGYTQPILALTANAMIGQAEEFISQGFDDFISKPIQTKYLNAVLIKYIKDKQSPEVIAAAKEAKDNVVATQKDINSFQSNADLIEKLRKDFARDHKNTFIKISQAIATGDIKTAHYLTHTLKGSAGLIQEPLLVQTAEDVERMLRNADIPSKVQLSTLESSLKHVLEYIAKPKAITIYEYKTFDKDKLLELLGKLEPLLIHQNVECIDLLDELHTVPETVVLRRQIEDFDFAAALQTLVVLKEILEECE